MLSHTTIGVSDLQAAQGFYAPILEALGWTLKFADETWAGWKPRTADRPLFILTRPLNGQQASAGNGHMIAFLASNRALVDMCHHLALDQGGTDEGGPGLRPDYHADYYGAYVRDLDGNKLCICCHEAP